MVACDNGSLDHLKLTQSSEEEEGDKQFYFFDRVSTYNSEHRDSITGIAKSPSGDDDEGSSGGGGGGNLVTCSADGSIVAWDLKVRKKGIVRFDIWSKKLTAGNEHSQGWKVSRYSLGRARIEGIFWLGIGVERHIYAPLYGSKSPTLSLIDTILTCSAAHPLRKVAKCKMQNVHSYDKGWMRGCI